MDTTQTDWLHDAAPPAPVPPKPEICVFPGCGRKVKGLGLCAPHHLQSWRGERLRPLRRRGDGRQSRQLWVELRTQDWELVDRLAKQGGAKPGEILARIIDVAIGQGVAIDL